LGFPVLTGVRGPRTRVDSSIGAVLSASICFLSSLFCFRTYHTAQQRIRTPTNTPTTMPAKTVSDTPRETAELAVMHSSGET